MLKLDNSLLDEIGLGALGEDQKKAMLQHIYETLELRVGTDLANQMTDQQLEEFEKFIDDGGDANQAQALQWLETNLPNYKEVVNRVFEELKVEIMSMAPQILASSAAAPAAPMTGGPASQPPTPVANPTAAGVAPQQPSPYYGAGAPQQSAADPYAPAAAPVGAAPMPAYGPSPAPNDYSMGVPAAGLPQATQMPQPAGVPGYAPQPAGYYPQSGPATAQPAYPGADPAAMGSFAASGGVPQQSASPYQAPVPSTDQPAPYGPAPMPGAQGQFASPQPMPQQTQNPFGPQQDQSNFPAEQPPAGPGNFSQPPYTGQ